MGVHIGKFRPLLESFLHQLRVHHSNNHHPQLDVSILWNLTNITVRLRRPRPIHPGANVAMDLLLWMALFVTGFFATIAAVNSIKNDPLVFFVDGITIDYDNNNEQNAGIIIAVGSAFTFLAL